MADDKKYSYQKVTEPQNLKWINDEQRIYVGDHFSNIKDAHEGAGSYYQTFIFDGTGTDSEHRNTITLLTLNNGVYVNVDYYVVEEVTPTTPPRYGYRVIGTAHYYGEDGSEILPSTGVNVVSDIRESPSLDNVRLQYVSSSVTYNNDGIVPDTGLTGAGINIFGSLIGQSIYGSIEPPPPLNSEIEYADYVTRYNSSSLAHVYNWEEFEAALKKIVDNGDGKPVTPPDPDDDTSEPDPGDPDYDPTEDPVPFPELPDDGDALSTGFIAAYRPTAAQLQGLAHKLWSSDFFDTIIKTNNNPMEGIISLHSVPFQVVTGSTVNCHIGNYDSEVPMLKLSAQYYTLNCGNILLPEHWASFLDYSPYTQIEIFIPFVGIRPLQVDDVMGRTLELKYNIDVLTGGAVAMLKSGNSVLYAFPCQLAQDIPYTMSSKMQLFSGIAQLALSGLTAAAAPSVGTVSSAISSALNVVGGKHTSVQRGGTLGGNIGVLGEFNAYLIIHRPKQSLPADYPHKKGYPSNITASLSAISGYTEVDSIHLSNIPCTDSERDEIERLLKEGVIL